MATKRPVRVYKPIVISQAAFDEDAREAINGAMETIAQMVVDTTHEVETHVNKERAGITLEVNKVARRVARIEQNTAALADMATKIRDLDLHHLEGKLDRRLHALESQSHHKVAGMLGHRAGKATGNVANGTIHPKCAMTLIGETLQDLVTSFAEGWKAAGRDYERVLTEKKKAQEEAEEAALTPKQQRQAFSHPLA